MSSSGTWEPIFKTGIKIRPLTTTFEYAKPLSETNPHGLRLLVNDFDDMSSYDTKKHSPRIHKDIFSTTHAASSP